MQIAVRSGAKIIGVNNRNLHDFQVDLSTTTRLVSNLTLTPDTVMIALSGINDRKDVEYFERSGVRAVLVGESLMRASDPKKKIEELSGNSTLVKVRFFSNLEKFGNFRITASSIVIYKYFRKM